MRKFVLLLIPLLLLLNCSSSALAQDNYDFILPDMSYVIEKEAEGELFKTRLYCKDGVIYVELEDTLWVLQQEAWDLLQTEINSYLAEKDPQELYEVQEVGEEIINSWKATRYRVFSKETGLLFSESWNNPDVFVPVKQILYDQEGRPISVETLLEFTLDPDFQDVDFSAAQPLPLGGSGVSTILTAEEFKELAPWYDCQQVPLPGFELTKIEQKSPALAGTYIELVLTYSREGENMRLMIFGEKDRFSQRPRPSQVLHLLRVRSGDTQLRPAVKLENSQVFLGFMDPIVFSDGERFLRSVILK
ncbi:MAG: hypothetical protein GX335_10805 [Firmicutes bacterium]|nr:hypothetical protein [Bacillota bacterium]